MSDDGRNSPSICSPVSRDNRQRSAGVSFWCWEEDGAVLGVMGIQDVKDITLIRHAYIHPSCQRMGIGSRLLEHLVSLTGKPLLIGTWADADWAVRFYEKHGFELVTEQEKNILLRRYWNIPERQIETSVVLASAQVNNLLVSNR